MTWKAIIFDFDYTLGDSSIGIHESVNYALENLGFNSISYLEATEAIGKSLPETLVHFTGEENRGLSDPFYELFMEKAMQVMVQKCKVYPEAKPTLQYLGEKGYRLAIASTKHRHRIDEILRLHDLSGFFETVIGGEDVVHHKPDPECLNMVIKRLDVEARECLYVGDNIVDAKASKRAGTGFIPVLTGFTTANEFSEYPYIFTANSLKDLTKLL